jgi:hypothetical protein
MSSSSPAKKTKLNYNKKGSADAFGRQQASGLGSEVNTLAKSYQKQS